MHQICYMTPPRSSQDASRTPQDGFCLRSGRQLGAILGIFFRPRRPPGPQVASKRPSWECLGTFLVASWEALGGVMEASWAGKVANMAPTWPQVGAQNGGKIRLGPSWRRLGSFLEASCSGFYAFLMHFCCMA